MCFGWGHAARREQRDSMSGWGTLSGAALAAEVNAAAAALSDTELAAALFGGPLVAAVGAAADMPTLAPLLDDLQSRCDGLVARLRALLADADDTAVSAAAAVALGSHEETMRAALARALRTHSGIAEDARLAGVASPPRGGAAGADDAMSPIKPEDSPRTRQRKEDFHKWALRRHHERLLVHDAAKARDAAADGAAAAAKVPAFAAAGDESAVVEKTIAEVCVDILGIEPPPPPPRTPSPQPSDDDAGEPDPSDFLAWARRRHEARVASARARAPLPTFEGDAPSAVVPVSRKAVRKELAAAASP